MNWKIFILFIFLANFGISQNGIGALYEEMPNDSIPPIELNSHTSIKPSIRIIKNRFTSPNKFFYSTESKNDGGCRSLSISPIIDLGIESGVYGSYRTGLGATLTADLNDKWFAKISAIEGIGETYSNIFTPKAYYFKKTTSSSYNYTDIRGRISFTPNHIFNFQAGIDHNFIGEGNRSMLLSDYGKPYPFVQIRTTLGRFEYMMQYKFLKEAKKVFNEPAKNLFYKIVLGDKSDNIMPVFKKCGPKTCETYYENNEAFNEALLKEVGAQEKYELNKKLVSFEEIPQDLIASFKTKNYELLQSL